ncbi:MAG: LuxR C-terminal-related transcriptional regulator [Actinobacteria bacterium]|nr:LuxR C-terminal-related transcriptional regulator [Actinomycetota bacterium]
MAARGEQGRAGVGMAERGDVLGSLERLLDGACEGRGGALFIVGPAGLGKTTLLEHAVALAKPRFVIGVGRGDQVESVLPFGLIGQALNQLLDGTRRGGSMALDADGGEGADISAQARFYGILRSVREAAVRPLLVALDDVHWSDPDSLTVIHLICRRLASLPVALIATARPWPAEAVTSAQDLATQGLAEIESLAPLSAAAARKLLCFRVSGQVPDEVVDQAIDLCGGNPLLLEQVALELRRSGRLSEGQVWFSRFVGVGAAGRRYLQAASVLGTRFRVTVATEVAGLSATEAATEIDGLFRGGLLYEADDGWARFTHALIRQSMYEDIAPPVRRELHAACFRALVACGAHPAEAAEHAVVAHLAGDPEAVTTVARAGREALRVGAVRAARQHLEAGMRLAGEAAPTELLFDLGAALVADGAGGQAIAVYERLLHVPELSTTDRVAVLRELGQASYLTGQVERAAACYESAVGLVEQDYPALAVGALLDHAVLHQTLSGPRAALPWAERAAELATAHGVMQASAQAAWGALAYRCGDSEGLAAAAAAAVTRVDLIPTSRAMDRHRYRHPALSYATVAVHAERFTDAERVLTEILSSAERRCEPISSIQATTVWIDGLCRLGRLDEALTLADRLTELAELSPYTSPLASSYRALVLLEQGQLEQAALCCAQLPTKTHHDRYSLHRADGLDLYLQAVLAHRQGDTETACSLFAQLQQWADRTGEADPSYLPWAADAVAAYLTCGRTAEARHVIDWVAQRAAGLPTRWPKIAVAIGRAALAEHTGDRATAEAHFTHALELHKELPMPLARAQTLTDYGAFLTRHGETTRARVLLAEALHIAEACGAGWHAHRARVEWRRAGGRTRIRKPDELSPQEASVAQLAQAGRTNREIAQQLHLSIKTVETHLGHIYQKLGIRSRWQLTGQSIPNTHE